MERDILADVNHPFIVKLNYGMLAFLCCQILIICLIICFFSMNKSFVAFHHNGHQPIVWSCAAGSFA